MAVGHGGVEEQIEAKDVDEPGNCGALGPLDDLAERGRPHPGVRAEELGHQMIDGGLGAPRGKGRAVSAAPFRRKIRQSAVMVHLRARGLDPGQALRGCYGSGNRLLSQACQQIAAARPPSQRGFVARLAGDTFPVLTSSTTSCQPGSVGPSVISSS